MTKKSSNQNFHRDIFCGHENASRRKTVVAVHPIEDFCPSVSYDEDLLYSFFGRCFSKKFVLLRLCDPKGNF